MEEKKYVKISLGTAICLAVIFILVVCGLIFGVYYYAKNEEPKENLIGANNDTNMNDTNNEVVDNNDIANKNVQKEEKEEAESETGNSSNYNVEETLKYEDREEDMYYEFLLCQKNTYFSVKKEYPTNYDEKFVKYCSDYQGGGDSAAWEEIESNYTQYEKLNYENPEDTLKIQKYSNPITIKIAKIHENSSAVYSMINGNYAGSKNDKIYKKVIEKAKNDNYHKLNKDFYDLTIEEETEITGKYAYGWDGKLFSEKDDNYSKLTGISIMNGNNTSSEDWNNNARAKKIKVMVNNEKEYIFDLEDKPEVQLFDVDYNQDSIEKPINIKIEVLEKYDGNTSSDVYISDIRFGFASSVSGAR